MTLRELDVVALIRDIPPHRVQPEFERPPVVGDTGTIVHVYEIGPGEEPMFIVECGSPHSKTFWLADVMQSELSLTWRAA